jgi:ribonuclease T2
MLQYIQKRKMMLTKLLLFSLLPLLLWGDLTLYPAKECALYNNLKHTKNRDGLHLDMTHTYTMQKHHKGQYLLKVPGATPAQRWVDDDCLTLRPLRGTPLYAKRVSSAPKAPVTSNHASSERTDREEVTKPLLLALSWHNAFCETHRYKKECKRGIRSLIKKSKSDDNFVLHGLWPQPKQKVYCGVERRYITADKYKKWNKLPEPKLSSDTKSRLREVMPGVDSNLHRHEWIKHGTCYGTDAQTYFEDAIALTQQVRDSGIAAFFRKITGKRVSLKRIRELFDEHFGKGTGKRVELRCKNGLISELWLHLKGHGRDLHRLLKEGRAVHGRCQRGKIDAAGFGQ